MDTQVTGTVWTIPEKGLEILLSPIAVADMNRDIVGRQKSAKGICLAPDHAESAGSITVEHALAIGEDKPESADEGLLGGIESLEDIILMWRESPRFPGPVGFYFAYDGDAEHYCRHEGAQLRKYLKGADNFILFVRLGEDSISGDLALIRGADITVRPVQLSVEFPLIPKPERPARSLMPAPAVAPEPGVEPVDAIWPSAPVPSTPPRAEATVAAAYAPKRTTRLNAWIGFTIVLAALLCAGAFWWTGARWPSVGGTKTAATLVSQPAALVLDLRVGRRGSDLEITWDRSAAVLQSAQRGFLYVNDGGQRTQVFLEQAHLKTGRVVYVPRSGDIDIKLEVVTPDDRLVRESVRVLQATPSSPGNSSLKFGSLTPEAAKPGTPARLAARPPAGAANETPDEFVTQPSAEKQRKVFLPPPSPNETSSYATGTAHIETAPLPSLPAPDVPFRGAALPLPGAVAAPPPPIDSQKVAPVADPPRSLASGTSNAPAGTDVVTPIPIRQVPVQLPSAVRSMMSVRSSTNEQISIEVVLRVDESGRVTTASTAPQDSVLKSQLAHYAVEAARAWRFKPATRSGRPVPSPYAVVFQFRR